MAKIITYEEIKEFVENHSNCKLLSDKYISANEKMNFLCACGNEFSTQFYQFKKNNKRQCNECGHAMGHEYTKLTYEHVKHYIEVESNSGCKLLDDKYVNNQTPMNLMCKCGEKFRTTWSKFKDRKTARKCEICKGRIWWNIDKIKKYVKENSRCKVLSLEYINSNEKMKFLCHCGREFYTTWSSFLHKNKRRCDKCGIKSTAMFHSTPLDIFMAELDEVHGDNYTIIGDYVNKNTKVLVRHNDCGFQWDVEPRNLVGNAGKSPTGCPICKSSKGELRISNYLEKMNIEYSTEYWFDDCRYIYPLPFDFYLNKYKTLIEYDGEHHYMPVGFSGDNNITNLKFEETKRNDDIKTQYCKDKNISLIRIPYWDFDNIEYILDKQLIGL